MGLVRKVVLFGVGLAVLSAEASRAFAVEATLVADAHVNSARPTVNSGAISNLNVGGGYTALLQFDLSTLPVGTTAAQVSRATLRLYCNRMDTAGMVGVQAVAGAWSESSVTSSTLPSLGSTAQVASVSQAGAYVVVDVTGLVQGWVGAPATNNGLALTAATAVVQFDSKENDLTGHAAVLDVVLASSGPAGAVGPQGPKGDTGAAGPPGAVGPQGAPGVSGDGVGVAYQGTYASTASYGLNDVVLFQGSSYISLIAANRGNVPSSSAAEWGVLASGVMGLQGPQGLTGAAGPQGLTGPTGATGLTGATGGQGPQGVAGPQGLPGSAGVQGLPGPIGPQGGAGPVGMTFQGTYSSVVNYGLADGVLFNGSGYISLVASNHGNTPNASPAQWSLFATGATGPTGPQGLQGVPGTPGLQGSPGVQGPAGAPGAVGVIYRGAWAAVTTYRVNDVAIFGGATYLAVTNSLGSEPDVSPTQWAVLAQNGVVGATGPSGAAATVNVGAVTTGAAGTQASVTNSGTANAAVLNFTIPQGAAGANGTGGGSGGGPETSGIPFAAVFHSVSFLVPFESVNNSNGAATETDAVLTWVPSGCVATQLSVFSHQANTVTVTLRQGTPGNMANTSLVCSIASGTACTASGNVTVAAGNFVDFNVSGANGTANGVWMALACN